MDYHQLDYADLQEQHSEKYTIQGLNTCAVETKARVADKILEVGCGSGLHSLMLSQSFLKKQGILVSCDFDPEMLDRVKKNYERSDFVKIKRNKVIVEDEVDFTEVERDENEELRLKYTCDIGEIVQQHGKFDKFVYACQANNERLPFPDNYFNSYIANLSLHLVANPQRMIREAWRVL